jgi:hypothetical protein
VTTPPAPGQLRDYLAATYGGALVNTVRRAGVTCRVCAAPVEGYPRCYPCRQHAGQPGTADTVGSMIYAIQGEQSHHYLRSYKGTPVVEESRLVVFLLAWLALTEHRACLEILTGHPVTHWSSVPSLPARDGEHPLHALVAGIAPGKETPLTAAPSVTRAAARTVDAAHFQVAARLPPDAHALVIDDTWTSGGHAQSAALAVRAAGAQVVSILTVARYLNKDWAPTAAFLPAHRRTAFDPGRCPWTGSTCPAR